MRSRDFPHSKDLFNKMLTERVRSSAENKEIYQLGHINCVPGDSTELEYCIPTGTYPEACGYNHQRTSGRMGTTFNAAGKLITAYSLLLMGEGGGRAKIEFP